MTFLILALYDYIYLLAYLLNVPNCAAEADGVIVGRSVN